MDDERRALGELLAAHADMERLTAEIGAARERRRDAARRLISLGRGTSWIARQLGVTAQAVDGFIKYQERQGKRRGPA
ncbi:LuxR family transcriptional regulator [Mycobacterium arosiense]|uniref:LuxR family transcriptional regulator n=1 Tax=Mycobacterium arosiense ATCC BAA-1401 = DSM 45069 TaxID=1265311 RepID=A0A1W9ZBT4_MYCAI|nr:LuxR family transcriptional regulator [Mycobacterium arosiense]ORA10952.1 LuxR family transcriptional regulator [Mycobacterium arosiense ATCC BAA-1401 = DSM 45069]